MIVWCGKCANTFPSAAEFSAHPCAIGPPRTAEPLSELARVAAELNRADQHPDDRAAA